MFKHFRIVFVSGGIDELEIITQEFARVIRALMKLNTDYIDEAEERYSKEFRALPLGVGLWSYTFLTPEGEVISTGYEPDEIERTSDPQQILRCLVIGSRRYPELSGLVPARPESAPDCHACNGSGRFGAGSCPGCGGIGWTIGKDSSP